MEKGREAHMKHHLSDGATHREERGMSKKEHEAMHRSDGEKRMVERDEDRVRSKGENMKGVR